jgi:hypothetical protein
MIAALVAVALSPQGGNFGGTFPHPTGNNGWEEYLMAADMVAGAEAARALYEASANLIARDRAAVSRYRRACELVRAGNKKPIVFPWKIEPYEALEFPAYAEIKVLGNLLQAEARVAFADGKPDAAARSIRDGLVMGRRIAGKTVIGGLVSIAVQSIAMKALNDGLHKLNASGARMLQEEFNREAAHRSPVIEQYFQELEHFRKSVRAFIASPESADEDAPEEIRTLTAAQIDASARHALAEVDKFEKELRTMFSREERFWTTPEVRSGDPAANFALQLLPFISAQSMVRNRTQVRLAVLHCRIMEYRRTYGKLPDRLAELNSAELTYDRATGGPFFYARTSSQSYLLYSLGTSETGRIDLVYRRQYE